MKTLFAAAGAALAGWFPGVATAQSGPMMNGGMGGGGWMWGYGGMWMPVILLVVVVAIVVWVVKRK